MPGPTNWSRQARSIAYAHGTQFTSEALEAYAAELAPLLPMDRARVYPVSGGSEAVETALRAARLTDVVGGPFSFGAPEDRTR